MSAKLAAEEGRLKGLILSFEEGSEWAIGRDPDSCQLLIEDPEASRRHLICRLTDEGIVVENLSETNPVEVNGEPALEPRLLAHGDTLKIGGTLFRFYEKEEAQLIEEESEKEPSRAEVTGVGPAEEEEEEPQPEEAAAAAEEEKELLEDRDTIFEEEEEPSDKLLAEIHFDLPETGRWMLKVVNGPNTGAEFAMQTGESYVLGTDPGSSDIVFHDTSVSRQHARITISEEEKISIQDLGSRNGTLLEGEPIETSVELPPNELITCGTTSFVVFDREGEMQTVISPLLPSIVKVLQQEKREEEPEKEEGPPEEREAPVQPAPKKEEKGLTSSALLMISIVTGFVLVAGIGAVTLFRSEPVKVERVADAQQQIADALSPFPSISYSFNRNTGTLLMVGHVLTDSDKKQLMHNLSGLPFIKTIDDSGIVIDEFWWKEMNPMIARNPAWHGVTLQATAPGRFVLSGYLENRSQLESLNEYMNANFPYLDLLENRVVVEQDVIASVERALKSRGMFSIAVEMQNGDLTLKGGVQRNKMEEFSSLLEQFKSIPGIRNVRDFVSEVAPEKSMINVTDRYEVSGISRMGGSNLSVVIDGRILTQGDVIDGMKITKITPDEILLEKDGVKYRIDLK